MVDDCPSSFQGFKVMRLKFNERSKAAHQLLWKRHSVRTYCEQKPPDRTLFVVNVPPYCTKEAFQDLFSQYGKVQEVYFHKKPSNDAPELPKHPHFSPVSPVEGFKVAYVVFANEVGVRRAMEASASTDLILSTDEKPVLTGMKKWQQEYNSQFVAADVLSNEIRAVMADYDKEKEASKITAEEDEEPDADGWVTVSAKKAKKKPQLLKEHEFKKHTKRKRKKQQEMVKFYTFQDRQTKIDNLAQLRKKFEEDKKRINMMKAARKFKPY